MRALLRRWVTTANYRACIPATVSIAAAGNDGDCTCSYPACYDSVISVSAVARNKQHARFSQRNAQVELAAPGVGIWSTVLASDNEPWSGTSMATPFVAGAAALLWSLHPECSNQTIRQAFAGSAQDLGQPGRDPAYGYGLIQVSDADQFLSRQGCET